MLKCFTRYNLTRQIIVQDLADTSYILHMVEAKRRAPACVF